MKRLLKFFKRFLFVSLVLVVGLVAHANYRIHAD